MDPGRFDALVTAHHGEIYRYLLRATSRASEADDLAQETFLRAYRAHQTLAPDANARAWLFTIATNVAKNHFRAESRRRRAHTAVRATLSATDGAGPPGGRRLSPRRRGPRGPPPPPPPRGGAPRRPPGGAAPGGRPPFNGPGPGVAPLREAPPPRGPPPH